MGVHRTCGWADEIEPTPVWGGVGRPAPRTPEVVFVDAVGDARGEHGQQPAEEVDGRVHAEDVEAAQDEAKGIPAPRGTSAPRQRHVSAAPVPRQYHVSTTPATAAPRQAKPILFGPMHVRRA